MINGGAARCNGGAARCKSADPVAKACENARAVHGGTVQRVEEGLRRARGGAARGMGELGARKGRRVPGLPDSDVKTSYRHIEVFETLDGGELV